VKTERHSAHSRVELQRLHPMKELFARGRRNAASRLFLGLGVVVLATIGLPACREHRDGGQGIILHHQIAPSPPHQGPATVSFQLADTNANPVSHAHISVEGDMTHPGMAPVFSDAQEARPGAYEAPINFTMGGDWVLLFHVTLADGRKFERQVDVKGVQSH